MGNEDREIQVPEIVLERYRESFGLNESVPDDVVVALVRDRIAEQAMIFARHPEDVEKDIGSVRKIFDDPVEMERANLSVLLVGLGILEANRIIEAKTTSEGGEDFSQEISTLADELQRTGKGAAFADEFWGSRWDVPPAPHGWRYDMRKWAEGKGLIKPIVTGTPGVNRGTYVGFTRKGELLQKMLHKRGCTVIVGLDDEIGG